MYGWLIARLWRLWTWFQLGPAYGCRKLSTQGARQRGWIRPKAKWVCAEIIWLKTRGPDLGCNCLALFHVPEMCQSKIC